VFCAQPEKTAKNYAEEFANYKLRTAALARMMQTEAFTNLGMDHDEHRDIERKFRYSPGGEGGVITLLNMFMVVFKIFHLFRTAHPGAREIRIMDCPAFKFTSDDRSGTSWRRSSSSSWGAGRCGCATSTWCASSGSRPSR
jgi:hypothetical protein